MPARKNDPRPRLWAGPQVGSRLLSSLTSLWFGSRNEFYVYGDCAYFDPDRCSQPLVLESTKVCTAFDELQFGGRYRILKRRGVQVVRSWKKKRLGSTGVRVGRSVFGIGQAPLGLRGPGRPNTFADHLKMIDLLRPVGKPLVPGSRLPAPVKTRCGKRP